MWNRCWDDDKNKILNRIDHAWALHMIILFAGFVSPYEPESQNRDLPYVPPTRLHFFDARGHFHAHPFVYQWVANPDSLYEYHESREQQYPVHLFVTGTSYRIAFFSFRTHLIGVDAPGQIFLAGTDNFGRDQSRACCMVGRISLSAGLLATTISLLLGLFLGTIAGFYGHWFDASLMRAAELFLVLPWFYLLLAVRAFLPCTHKPGRSILFVGHRNRSRRMGVPRAIGAGYCA